MAEMKKLDRMPAWGTKSQKDYCFYAGKTELTTRKAIKAALEDGKSVMYKKRSKRKYRKSANLLVGSKTMTCECGEEVTVDANVLSVRCYKCTNKMAIKRGGFLHSKTVLDQEPKKEKEKSMASKKKSTKGTKEEKGSGPKSDHMSVENIRKRFDNPDNKRKPGYFVTVFSELKKAGSMTVTELAEATKNLENTPDKYKDQEALEKQIRFYSKSIWGKRSNLVKLEGDTVTYVKPEDRS